MMIPRIKFITQALHWARAATKTLVKVGNLEEPYVVPINHGSKINLMSNSLYAKSRCPIDRDQGWMVWVENK